VKIKLGKGGKPLMVGGKVVTNCDCCGAGPPTSCDPTDCTPSADCPYNITVSGSISGTLHSSLTCGDFDVHLSGDCGATIHYGTTGAPVNICRCTTPSYLANLHYDPCQGTCSTPDCDFYLTAGLTFNGTYWDLGIGGGPDPNSVCGSTCPVGGANLHEENLGGDPVGVHSMSFADADCPTVSYDVTVTIALA
jgi:hypothetical protein